MQSQNLYWEIEDYSGQVITLMKEGEKIYSQKLTKKQVEQKTGGIPGLSDVTDMLGGSGSDSAAATEIELIKSRMIIGETVDDLHLNIQVEPYYPYGVGKGLAGGRNIGNRRQRGSPSGND